MYLISFYILFYRWRVFSCGGSARSDIVVEAMLMAYDAGIDILSMSLGSILPWSAPNDLQSRVISKISASGVSGTYIEFYIKEKKKTIEVLITTSIFTQLLSLRVIAVQKVHLQWALLRMQ